jgi:hypothetical protein
MKTLRLITLSVISVLIVGSSMMPTTFAHEGEDHGSAGTQADAAHAAQDMANVPVSEVERQTNANKKRIKSQTGVEPGAARSRQSAAGAATFRAAAIADDPGIAGTWSSVYDTEVVPVFQAILPNGKILIWDSVGDNASETYPNHTFTRAMVWNPTNNTFKRVDVQGYNIFCAGFAHLPNGNILVAGGNANAKLEGIVQTHIFNWQTETWSRSANMQAGRWYPSLTTMANGEHAIVGGGPAMAEIYQANGAIRPLTNFNNATYGSRVYPFMISRPDTQLGLFGPYNAMFTVNTAGNGAITGSANRDGRYRDYGSFAPYDIGKNLVVGGGNATEDGVANMPTKSTVVVDSNTGLVPTVTASGAMSSARRQANATVLADGSVLATGGQTSAAKSLTVDLDNAVTTAERWDPATGQWTQLASASRIRQYHSTAALLPDGRVITGGGGICGDCMRAGYLEKNIEYFTPPYLYKKDGSGELAARPVIATAPTTVAINTAFAVTSPQAASIKKVALVGLGDVTHGIDQGQRYIPLKFSVAGTTITATSPGNGGIAPPGYYMLFVTDAGGVPSVAKIVQVAKAPNPLLSQVKNNNTGRCIDLPNSSLANAVYLQTYTCNNTKAQALSRLPNDGTLRVLGNCLDVPSSNFAAGQKIWSYKCNNTNAQKWQFGTDGTIRPVAKTTLCLAPQSATGSAATVLATCNGAALQKWTW